MCLDRRYVRFGRDVVMVRLLLFVRPLRLARSILWVLFNRFVVYLVVNGCSQGVASQGVNVSLFEVRRFLAHFGTLFNFLSFSHLAMGCYLIRVVIKCSVSRIVEVFNKYMSLGDLLIVLHREVRWVRPIFVLVWNVGMFHLCNPLRCLLGERICQWIFRHFQRFVWSLVVLPRQMGSERVVVGLHWSNQLRFVTVGVLDDLVVVLVYLFRRILVQVVSSNGMIRRAKGVIIFGLSLVRGDAIRVIFDLDRVSGLVFRRNCGKVGANGSHLVLRLFHFQGRLLRRNGLVLP